MITMMSASRPYLIRLLALAFLLTVAARLPAGSGARITGAAIDGHKIRLEVVSSPAEMQRGLMFRRHLAADAGMLFVYSSEQPLSFWMKNTRLPLSIAFIDEEGVIINIEKMEPFDEKNRHESLGEARYALEVNQGWFDRKGIGPGDRVHFLKTVDAR